MQLLLEVVGSIVLFGVYYFVWKVYSERTFPSLALQEKSVHRHVTSTTDVQIFLRGRPVGLMAIVQAMFRIEPVTMLVVTPSYAEYNHRRLSGTFRMVIPLKEVASIWGGSSRPIWLLVGSIVVAIMALGGGIVEGQVADAFVIAFTLVCCGGAAFYFNNKIYVAIDAGDRSLAALGFQTNAIGGKSISVPEAMEIVTVLRQLVAVAQLNEEPDQSKVQQHEELDFADDGPVAGELPDFEEPDLPDFSNVGEIDDEPAPFDEDAEDEEALALELFEEAKRHVQQGNKEGAIAALQELLRRYPSSSYADRARSSLRKKGIEPAG